MTPADRPTCRLCRDRDGGRSDARNRWGHAARRFALALALLAALAAARPGTAIAEPTEQEVKAALIFNIMRFVEWPATVFASPGAALVIAFMGHDEVTDVLGPMLAHKTVEGHSIEVRHVRTVDEARRCHVLYVASSESKRIDSILKALRGASTLTVSDIGHFAERGGHINLVLTDQRVRVFVNPTSAEDSHLTISAKLLSLAQIVGSTP